MKTGRLAVAAVLLVCGACSIGIGNPQPPVRDTVVEHSAPTQAPGSPGTDWEQPPATLPPDTRAPR